MRVALVTATPQTVQAGSGTYVAGEALALGLRALGHPVTLVTSAHCPPWVPYTLHRFHFNTTLPLDEISESDIVVGFDMDGFRLSRRRNTPFVAYVHGMLADEARFERGAVRWSMLLQSRAERWSASHAARVLTPSNYLRRRVVTGYHVAADRVHVVPPAFDHARWTNAFAAIPHADKGVLCVGRMYPRKGHATLLHATHHLRRIGDEAYVTIVGDGPERPRLTRLRRSLGIEGLVNLPGHLDFATLARRYAECAVFCLPSYQEGFGLVLLEAMAAGKPVVACRGTAAEELVDDGINGLLVSPGDPVCLAEALATLLRDGDLCQRMGAVNRTTAAQYAPGHAARRFVEAVTPVVG